MKVLLEYCSNEIVIKNSRFIAEVFPIDSQKDAREKLALQKKKYFDASHVCHAFMAGLKAETSGMSDDGEPSGTAGRPMLDVLKGSGITNILLTVTRYFGGTLLGTGGLVKAYGDSAKEILSLCSAEEYVEKSFFSFSSDYGLYEVLKRQFVFFHVEKLTEDYSDEVKVSGSIYKAEFEEFASSIKNLSRGKIIVSSVSV